MMYLVSKPDSFRAAIQAAINKDYILFEVSDGIADWYPVPSYDGKFYILANDTIYVLSDSGEFSVFVTLDREYDLVQIAIDSQVYAAVDDDLYAVTHEGVRHYGTHEWIDWIPLGDGSILCLRENVLFCLKPPSDTEGAPPPALRKLAVFENALCAFKSMTKTNVYIEALIGGDEYRLWRITHALSGDDFWFTIDWVPQECMTFDGEPIIASDDTITWLIEVSDGTRVVDGEGSVIVECIPVPLSEMIPTAHPLGFWFLHALGDLGFFVVK